MLDLTGYQLTFDEEFNSISISQGGGTVWSDIRPGSRMSPVADIGFGDSAFVDSASGIQSVQPSQRSPRYHGRAGQFRDRRTWSMGFGSDQHPIFVCPGIRLF
jgi:hypothetical protein